jgi:hypothetical protein
VAWISGRAPSGGFTLTTTDVDAWCHESHMNANIGGRYRVFKRTAAGSVSELGGGPFNDGVEFGTSAASMTWAGNVTDTAFAEDDRILVRFYITNVGTMGSGFTGTLTFNAADASDGDSFFNIAETVTFKAEPTQYSLACDSGAFTHTGSAAALYVVQDGEPVIVAHTTIQEAAGGVTEDINVPWTGFERVDDVFVVYGWMRSTTPTVSVTNLTELITYDDTTQSDRHFVYGKRLVGGDSAPVVDRSASSGDMFVAAVLIRGCKTSGTPWTVGGSGSFSASNPVTITGVTTPVARSLVLAFVAYGDDNAAGVTVTATDPSTFTEHYQESAVGADGSLAVCEGVRDTAGATGDLTADWGITFTATADGAGVAVAFEPPSATAYTLPCDSGAFTETGTAATLLYGRYLSAEAGSYTETGTAATLTKTIPLAADSGAFTLTGTAATLTQTTILAAESGSYTETGTAATLTVGYYLECSSGSYAETGTAAGLSKGHPLACASGSYTLTGTAAGLLEGHRLGADSGAYTETGTAATLTVGHYLSAGSGSYTLTGQDAGLVYEQAGNFTLTAESGVYVLTGTAAALRQTSILPADSGAYVETGTAAGLTKGSRISADSGAYSETGTAATLRVDRLLGLASGAYALTGADVTLDYGQQEEAVLVAESGAWAVTGGPATLTYTPIAPPTVRRGLPLSPADVVDIMYGTRRRRRRRR